MVVLSLFLFIGFQINDAKCREYYRTFEIIGITANSMTLKDSDGNVITVDKKPEDLKVGYNVRYDSVRKRLHRDRWQDYEVTAISNDAITLHHKSGDVLSVAGNYTREFAVGDQVRYDSVGNKLEPAEKGTGQWKQYTVVAESSDKITLQDRDGQKIILYFNNNLYPEQTGVYLGKYNVGDHVRYNAATNQLRKGIIRTYDWHDYKVKEVTEKQIILINKDKEEVTLKNKYDGEFQAGDPVKYDRLNDMLKKAR